MLIPLPTLESPAGLGRRQQPPVGLSPSSERHHEARHFNWRRLRKCCRHVQQPFNVRNLLKLYFYIKLINSHWWQMSLIFSSNRLMRDDSILYFCRLQHRTFGSSTSRKRDFQSDRQNFSELESELRKQQQKTRHYELMFGKYRSEVENLKENFKVVRCFRFFCLSEWELEIFDWWSRKKLSLNHFLK